MKKQKPPCETVLPWLKNNLGPQCLGRLTGTDAKALAAALHIIDLYSYHPDQSVLDAFRQVVTCMQPHCRELAYHGIAHLLDWPDRQKVWDRAGLPQISTIRCQYEPLADRAS